MEAIATKTSAYGLRQPALLLIYFAVAVVAIAIDIRAAGPSFDEGVYWQSLRSMSAGSPLYEKVFDSQPPLFLLSIYPFYELLGSTIVSARIGVAALSLLSLPGAYLMGKALGGRAGAITAVVLLIVTPMYLAQSHVLEAEGPATAFLFLTVGAALMWWEHPTGRKGMAFAVLSGVTLTIGILIKLLDVTAVQPILLIVLARIWRNRHEAGPDAWSIMRPIGAGIVAAVIATLIILAPFLRSLNALLAQVVTFHLEARDMMIASQSENVDTLGRFFAENGTLGTATIIGIAVAIIRRDWRIVFLVAWLLATLFVLLNQVPLWSHHTFVLIPPLIAIIALGVKDLPMIPIYRPIAWEQRAALLMSLLAFAVVISSLRHDYHHYRYLRTQTPGIADQLMERVAADIERLTTRDQWVITDWQFAAALANRDTPPGLVDTSFTRVHSGNLTSRELIQTASDPRVRAVVFAADHLTAAPVASFRPWVTQHFSLVRTYYAGIELWAR